MSDAPEAITIRACVEADAPAFRDLRLEALRSHPEVFSADYTTNERAPLSFWIDRVSHSADDPEQTIYVAVAGETLVGMSGIRRGSSPKTSHSAIIWGVYVRPDWRGHQLAEQLIDACMAWAQRHAVQIVKLAVVTTNTAAVRCYTRCGFTIYGVEPRAIYYAGRYYDDILMAKQL